MSKISINIDWCKGCGICVAYCPKKVLALKNDQCDIIDEASCILCSLCEIRCPDFAIKVVGEKQNAKQ